VTFDALIGQMEDAKEFYSPVNLQEEEEEEQQPPEAATPGEAEVCSSAFITPARSPAGGSMRSLASMDDSVAAAAARALRRSLQQDALRSSPAGTAQRERPVLTGDAQQNGGYHSPLPHRQSRTEDVELRSVAAQQPLSGQRAANVACSPTEAWVAATSAQLGMRLGERSAAHSPQRLPPRRQQGSACGSEVSWRSISEPRQRLKRPPDKGLPGTPAASHQQQQQQQQRQHATAPGAGLPAPVRQRPGQEWRSSLRLDASHIAGSPEAAPSSRGAPAMRAQGHSHARSISLDGKCRSAVQLAGAFDAAAAADEAAAPADIVTPGSLYGPSPA
jgi:hypothetical protein